MIWFAIVAVVLCTTTDARAEWPYNKMRIGGIVFTAVGAAKLVAGAIVFGVGAANEEQVRTDYGCEGEECPLEAGPDLEAATELQTLGIVSLIAGPASLAAGIPLWVVGELGRKKDEEATVELRPRFGGLEIITHF